MAQALGAALVASPPEPTPHAVTLGRLTQADGRRAVTVLPPLGRLDPAMLDALLALGHPDVRASTAPDAELRRRSRERRARLLDGLATAGFVVSEDSGWWGLTACSGLGACARARLDVRALAAERATRRRPGAAPEHWSACERGCGRPPGVREMAA